MNTDEHRSAPRASVSICGFISSFTSSRLRGHSLFLASTHQDSPSTTPGNFQLSHQPQLTSRQGEVIHMECCACGAQARTATYSNLLRFFDPAPQIPMEKRKSAPKWCALVRTKRDTGGIYRGLYRTAPTAQCRATLPLPRAYWSLLSEAKSRPRRESLVINTGVPMLVQPALLPLVQLDLDSVAEPQLSQSPISNLQSPSPSPPQATRTKYQAPRMKPAHLLPQMTRNPRSHHKMRHPTPPLREPAHLRPTPLPGTKPSMRQMPPSPPQARRTWSPPPTPTVSEHSSPIAGPVD